MPHHSSMHSIAKQTLPSCYSLRHLTQASSILLHPVRSAGTSSSSTRPRWGTSALPLPKLPPAAVPRAQPQRHYSNNFRAHRPLRVTGRPRAVARRARGISAVRWTLRSEVCALSEVSMSNGKCAGSRRSIGLTMTRKKFSCCSNRCSASASSVTLLRQRYNYIFFSLLHVDGYTALFLHSFSWVVRMTFTNVLLLITGFCSSTVELPSGCLHVYPLTFT